MSLIVPQTAQAPTTLTIRFLSPVFGPDLTLITAVTANLLRRDGTTTSLTLSIVSATQRELIAQYQFAGGEITTTGAYYLAPLLALQGGQVSSETVALFVAGPYSAIPRLETDAWIMGTVPIPSLGPIRSTWVDVSSSITASAFAPHMALDLRTTPISVALWPAQDGDIAVFSDVFNAAAAHNFTAAAAAGQTVPVGDGTFAASATRSTNGFQLRLRYRKSSTSWLPW